MGGEGDEPPDEWLVEQFKTTRNNDHFAALCSRHRDRILKACWYMLGNWADAEDIAQDTLVRAFSGIDGFDGGNFRSWLSTIAHNLCVNHVRSGWNRLVGNREDGQPETRQPTDASQAELSQEVTQVLGQLPPDQRVALKLMYYEGYSYREIAALQGWTIKKVKTCIQNGKLNAAKMLRRLRSGEGEAEVAEAGQ